MTQESIVDSTDNLDDFTFAPECSTSVEIGPDSTNNFYTSFQVSPDHPTGKINLARYLGLTKLFVFECGLQM